MERWTVNHFESGIIKAKNGKGFEVEVYEVTDRLLRCQGIRFGYKNPSTTYNTFVNNDGKMLSDHDTHFDLFLIN